VRIDQVDVDQLQFCHFVKPFENAPPHRFSRRLHENAQRHDTAGLGLLADG
jgi:hypothetical protein